MRNLIEAVDLMERAADLITEDDMREPEIAQAFDQLRQAAGHISHVLTQRQALGEVS